MNKLLTCILVVLSTISFAQQDSKQFSLDANFFYGTILEHNPDISHLITGHPNGMILSYNRKTYGHKAWESRYNYPDWGFSFVYQNNLMNTVYS